MSKRALASIRWDTPSHRKKQVTGFVSDRSFRERADSGFEQAEETYDAADTMPAYRRQVASVIQKWMKTCEERHGDHCSAPRNVSPALLARPIWLIDVNAMCLIHAQSNFHYVALSYVWGRVNIFHTTKANLTSLQLPLALHKLNLPSTISNAILLVRHVGQRYLWVDCLCIVQDDTDEKHVQLNHMAAIYSNASLTVVACSGRHADHGLRTTVCENFIPGCLYRRPSSYTDEYWAVRAEHNRSVLNSPWFERGWTFQERIFSQRAVYIFDEMFTWECHCTVWSEHCTGSDFEEKCRQRFSELAREYRNTIWPDLEEFSRLVCDFNARLLTYDGDARDAFAGITSSLAHTYEGGFLFGHPEMFFDVALLWQPKEPMRRRLGATSGGELCEAPSWSWLGWEGLLDPISWACGYDYVHHMKEWCRQSDSGWKDVSGIWKIRSTVRWTCYGASEKSGRHIECSYHKWRDLEVEEGWELQGWTKYPPYTTRLGSSFVHSSIPDVVFQYPIPLRDPRQAPLLMPQTSQICCATRRAFLTLGSSLGAAPGPWNISTEIKCATVSLMSGNDSDSEHWAGVLRLNTNERWHGHYHKGTVCELVEVSAGYTENDSTGMEDYEWLDEDRPMEEVLDEFYNVLWVEWKAGVAYRKALGRVVKAIWDEVALETIELRLG